MRRLNLFAHLLTHTTVSQSSMTVSLTFLDFTLFSSNAYQVYYLYLFFFCIQFFYVEQFEISTFFDFNQPIGLRDLQTRGVHFSRRIFCDLDWLSHSRPISTVLFFYCSSVKEPNVSTFLFRSFQDSFFLYTHRTYTHHLCYSFEDYEFIVSSGLCWRLFFYCSFTTKEALVTLFHCFAHIIQCYSFYWTPYCWC